MPLPTAPTTSKGDPSCPYRKIKFLPVSYTHLDVYKRQLLNSLKVEGSFTTSTVFKLPTAETFAGLSNYVYGVTKMGFLSSLGYSLVITVTSVALILLCCSMTGWYLTRVNNKLSKFMNLLIVFSMVCLLYTSRCV